MTPNTVGRLAKTITVKSGGLIATYKLRKDASVPVLFLAKEPTPEQLAKITEILK